MRAVYYDQFRKPPVVTTLPDPVPTDGGVVIKLEATGLCRSDFHGWMGHDSDIHLPHVPGHELAGTIVAKGKHVSRFREGDRVTVPFVSGCGHCHECHTGNQQVCENQFQPGFTAWGSFAEYVAIDLAETNLIHLPESMDFITAASLGCRFATAFRGLVDVAKIQPGEWVAVHGAGGVGLSAIMIAAACGAMPIAIDLNNDKLAFAKSLGAVATINAKEARDVVERIREITSGGSHVSMDALGSPVTCFNSVAGLRRRGRHVQAGLMTGDHASPKIPMSKVIAHELQVLGTHGMQAHRYDVMLAMIAAGKLDPQKLVGRHITLDDAPEALMAMDRFDGTGISVITTF